MTATPGQPLVIWNTSRKFEPVVTFRYRLSGSIVVDRRADRWEQLLIKRTSVPFQDCVQRLGSIELDIKSVWLLKLNVVA